MAEEPPRSNWELVRDWLRAVAVPVVLSVFAAWQFWLKEVVWPAQAPVNLTTELTIKEAGIKASSLGRTGAGFKAIELTLTANNPSRRIVYLLQNYWVAYGQKVENYEDHKWDTNFSDLIAQQQPTNSGTHWSVGEGRLIAAGYAFNDIALKPQETIFRTVVFYVEEGKYDFLEVLVNLPSSTKKNCVTALPPEKKQGCIDYEWSLNSAEDVEMRVYKIGSNGARTEITDEIDERLKLFHDATMQLQIVTSQKQLSLWQKEPSAPASMPLDRPE